MAALESLVAVELLFARTVDDGEIKNLEILTSACPKVFHAGNRWVKYARKWEISRRQQDWWKWKATEKEVRNHQFKVLLAVQQSGLEDESRLALEGWMLSEMLEEIPRVF